MAKKENTESKIVEAAREVFHRKGFDGARMQEIADTAQINKGLLHYYFKSKNKLFDKVFGLAFDALFRKLGETLNADRSIFEKIEVFCEEYISMVSRNSYIPRFVINELGKNPERFIDSRIGQNKKELFEPFFKQIEQAGKDGLIRPIDPRHLMVNMISLCVFPFLAAPMLQVMAGFNAQELADFQEARKKEVADFIIQGIKI